MIDNDVGSAINKMPTYKRIYGDLRSSLEDGLFDEALRLPTEAELERKYGVSRSTIRQAFQALVSEGMVYRVPGRGTFSTGLANQGQYLRSVGDLKEMMAWPDTEMEVIRPFHMVSHPVAAGKLESGAEQVMHMVQRRWHAEVPFGLIFIYLSREVGQRILKAHEFPNRGKATVIDTVERVTGISIVEARQSITAAAAPEHVAKLIGCDPGAPILQIERIYYRDDATPVELANCYYNPHRYTYNLRLRRSDTGEQGRK